MKPSTRTGRGVWPGWKEETCRPSPPGLVTRFLFIVFGLLVVWSGAAFGLAATDQTEAPSVSISVDRTEVTIGDPIRYTISVTAAANIEVEIPLLGEQVGDFTVLDFGEPPPRTENGQVVTSRWFRLTTFETGHHLLPGPTVRYRHHGERERIDGNDVSITVISLLAEAGQNPELRDIKPPEVLPFDWRPYGLVAVAGLVLAGLGGGLFVYLRRLAPAAAPAVAPAASQVALEALDRLHARGLIEKQQFETYYVSLSAIVREYLENGLNLRAPEMTTEEFLSVAARDHQLSPVQQARLAEFLSQADLVKFARHRPGPEESQAAYRAARRFVEETRPPQDRQDHTGPVATATEVSDAPS